VKRYDLDEDGKLKFTEFCNLFLPFKKEFENLLLMKNGNYTDLFESQRELFS
jgi:hypothetical protein